MSDQSGQRQGSNQANHHAHHRQPHSLPDYQPQDIVALCAQCQTNADFIGPLTVEA